MALARVVRFLFRSRQLVVLVALAALVAAAAAAALSSCREGLAAEDKVSLFWDANFGAEFARLPVGEYPGMDAAAMGWEEDRDADISFGEALSSLKIPEGLAVTLYEKPKFKGKSLKLGAGEHRLRTWGLDGKQSDTACGSSRGKKGGGKSTCWNDTASSLKVTKA